MVLQSDYFHFSPISKRLFNDIKSQIGGINVFEMLILSDDGLPKVGITATPKHLRLCASDGVE